MKNSIPAKEGNKSSSNMRNLLLGNMYIFFAIVLFSLNIPVVKVLIPAWLQASDVTLVRVVGGAALFWIASLFVKKDKIERQDFLKIFLGGGFSLFVFVYLLNVSLKYGNPIDISIIMTLPPMYIIVYQILFKHRKPSILEVLGMLAAFAGAVIVIMNGHASGHASNPLLGDILAMLTGICYAAYLLILEKPTHKYKPIPMLKWVFLGACIPCLAICWNVANAPILHSAAGFTPWFWVVFLAFGPSFLAYLLVNPAIKMIGSELVSIYQYLMPVIATIVAVMMGEAEFEWVEGVAIVVIIAGMVLTDIGNNKKMKKIAEQIAQSTEPQNQSK